MRFGMLTYLLAKNMGYEEVVDWAGQNGFACLEVDVTCAATPHKKALLRTAEVLSAGPAGLRAYLEPLRRNGIVVNSLFNYGPNKLDPDPQIREQAQAGLRETIRAAALLGAPLVVTSVGSPFRPTRELVNLPMHLIRTPINPWGVYYHAVPHPDRDRLMQESYEIFAEQFTPLAQFAADHGVKIAFEAAPQGGGSGAVAYSPETFDGLFKVATHPNLGLNFDPSHLVWQGIDYLDAAAQYARTGRVFCCHAKDTEILWSRVKYVGWLGDGWWRFRLPGWGEVRWPELIKTLVENGYDDVMTVEQEDVTCGWAFDADGRVLDLDLAKKGYTLALDYVKHACRVAGVQV